MIYYVHSKGLPFGILSKVYYYVHAKACDVRSRVFSALSDVRGNVFLDVAYHAYVGFSMGLQRLVMGFVRVKGLSSELFVSLAIVKLFRVGYRLLFSVCRDVAVFLYGVFGYGSK